MESSFVNRSADTAGPKVAELQRPVASSTVRRMVVGSATDRAEHEADLVADVAMTRLATAGPSPAVRLGANADSKIRRSTMASAAGGVVDNATANDIEHSRGGGRPLESKIRRSMEGAFGADFSNVRMHVDAHADDLNSRIGASAFTTGSDVFVRRQDYSPTTSTGQRLLAHELAHTVQQGSSKIRRSSSPDSGQTADHSPIASAAGSDRTIRRLMSPADFKKKSGGALSGKRDRVLKVDQALKDVSGAMSVSVALDKVIQECNTYLSGPGSKDSTRVKGVKLLLKDAIAELAAWRLRARIPLPDFVFRMDERSPATIAKDGFQPWNPTGSISMIEHVRGSLETARADLPGNKSGAVGALAKPHSQFVSTAADLEFAKDPVLLAGLLNKVFYKIDTSANPDTYTDAGEHFDSQNVPNPFEKQLEFIQRGGIPGSHVVAYANGKSLEDFVLGLADASSITWTPMPAAV